MGDEFQDVSVDKPLVLNLGTEPTRLRFGFDGSKTGAMHSVVIETIKTVSGAPAYPILPTLDKIAPWRIFRRRAIIADREGLIRRWEKAYTAWVAEGRPDAEVLIRHYIPRAKITEA